MKTRFAAFAAVSAIMFSGCATQEVKPAPECVYPDSPAMAAPAWVCDQPVEGATVSAVGVAEKSRAGVNFMKDMAVANARTELARNMQVHVQNLVKQYVETTGGGSSETVDKVLTSVTKQVTDQKLEGSRIFKSATNPSTGSMYVLVGVDDASARRITENAVRTSMQNDAALWQQFKAQKSQEELAAEIAKGGQ